MMYSISEISQYKQKEKRWYEHTPNKGGMLEKYLNIGTTCASTIRSNAGPCRTLETLYLVTLQLLGY